MSVIKHFQNVATASALLMMVAVPTLAPTPPKPALRWSAAEPECGRR